MVCLYRYGVRMSDVQNPARELARRRWGSTVVDRAVETVAARSDELDPEQLERLRAVVDESRAGA